MERKNQRLRPTKTFTTAKTITKSQPLVAASRDHSTTPRYSQTTLNYP